MLKEQIKDQISNEGEAIANKRKDNNDFQAGIIQGFKDGYEVAGYKYASLWKAAEEKAAKYEKALKEIRKWELATGARIKVRHLDILKDIMETVNKALTPKTGEDDR